MINNRLSVFRIAVIAISMFSGFLGGVKHDGECSQISITGKANKNSAHLENIKEKIANNLLAEKSLKLRRA